MRKVICIDPRTSQARPNNQRLEQMNVEGVRYVFKSHAVNESTNAAIDFYRRYADSHNKRNIIVVNQESHHLAPWIHGNWDEYHSEMYNLCRTLARQLNNAEYDLVVWNEGDIAGESSVQYPADQYGKLLRACYQGWRDGGKHSRVYTQGFAAAAPIAVQYLRTALQTSNNLRDIIILRHPYGQYIGSKPPNIPTGWFGRLDLDLAHFRQFNLPIGIGEIGVSEPNEIPSQFYTNIAIYMQSVYQYCLEFGCTDFCWFGYSDIMRWAGIVNLNDEPKQPIFNTFCSFPAINSNNKPKPPTVPQDPNKPLRTTARVNARLGESTSSTIITTLPANTYVDWSPEVEDEENVKRKIGNSAKWIRVVLPDGRRAFVNASFLSLTK